MRIMPFTPKVYNQLLNAGYTHLMYSHFDNFTSNSEEKRSVILEVAMPGTFEKNKTISLHSDEVKLFPNSTTTRYYIRSKNISNITNDANSYLLSFTKTEAIELQDNYQALVNTPFTVLGEQLGTIICITAAPFDEINKWIFFQFFTTYQDTAKALSHYFVPYYDVLVIGMLKGTNEYMFESLLPYLRNNNIDIKDLPPSMHTHPAVNSIEA